MEYVYKTLDTSIIYSSMSSFSLRDKQSAENRKEKKKNKSWFKCKEIPKRWIIERKKDRKKKRE